MERRVSLPSFGQIAGELPRPALPASRSIPYEPASHRDPAYSPVLDGGRTRGPGTQYYTVGAHAASYSSQQQQQQQQAVAPSLVTTAYDNRQAPKAPCGVHNGVISIYDAQQLQAHGNNVHAGAQPAAADPAVRHGATTSPSGLAPPSPFAHSPLSPHHASYHMPPAPPPPPPQSRWTAAAAATAAPLTPGYTYSRSTGLASRAPAPAASTQHAPHLTTLPHLQTGAPAAQHGFRAPPPLHDVPLSAPVRTRGSINISNDDDDDDNDSIADIDDRGSSAGRAAAAANGAVSSAKLRTIHKLAERRRRREMKALFDRLRRCLPIDKTIRVSKWETLRKAIDVIASQEAEIRMLRMHIEATKAPPPG